MKPNWNRTGKIILLFISVVTLVGKRWGDKDSELKGSMNFLNLTLFKLKMHKSRAPAVWASEFCMMAPNIWGLSVYILP